MFLVTQCLHLHGWSSFNTEDTDSMLALYNPDYNMNFHSHENLKPYTLQHTVYSNNPWTVGAYRQKLCQEVEAHFFQQLP